MTSEEMSKALTDYFSSIADKAAEDLFGTIIKQYQKLNEALLETAVRLVNDKAIVEGVLKMTGQAFVAFATTATRNFTEAEQAAAYLKQNPDVAAAGMDAAQHYQRYGQAEGRIWPTGTVTYIETVTMKMIAFSESLIEMAGGLDKLTEAASIYFDKFN